MTKIWCSGAQPFFTKELKYTISWKSFQTNTNAKYKFRLTWWRRCTLEYHWTFSISSAQTSLNKSRVKCASVSCSDFIDYFIITRETNSVFMIIWKSLGFCVKRKILHFQVIHSKCRYPCEGGCQKLEFQIMMEHVEYALNTSFSVFLF